MREPKTVLKQVAKKHGIGKAWQITLPIILEAMDQHKKDVLEDYTEFLLNEGYCDSDVYAEPPTAIDRYLHPELRKK